MTTPKALKQQQLAPTIGCEGRPTKTTQHFLMENKNSALIVERKVMDLSHQPALPDGEQKLCSYCGKKGHGLKSPTSIRRSECPAFDHMCKHCNHLHHFETICCSKNKAKPTPLSRSANPPHTPAPSADENAVFIDNTIFDHPSNRVIFDSLCSLSLSAANNSGQCSVSLDHHTYNQLTDTWIRQASKPQPFITVTVTISTSDYTAFGLTIAKPTTSVTFSAIADTGCQSCLAGISTIHHLGMTHKDLIPVTLQMHAANNAQIAILGAAIIQFSGQSNSGKTLFTHQLSISQTVPIKFSSAERHALISD